MLEAINPLQFKQMTPTLQFWQSCYIGYVFTNNPLPLRVLLKEAQTELTYIHIVWKAPFPHFFSLIENKNSTFVN